MKIYQIFTTSGSKTTAERLTKRCCTKFNRGGPYGAESTISPSAEGFM
jgi:hypothetical protein